MRRYLLKILKQPEKPLIGTNDPPQDIKHEKIDYRLSFHMRSLTATRTI